MKIDQFISEYPWLYHMATHGSWPSIRQHGLLSTSAILDLVSVSASERAALESQRRHEINRLSRPGIGSFELRDNLPLDDRGLLRCLQDGLTPKEWYETINRRVFFWVSEHRLEGMLDARAYRDRQHTVLILDTSALLGVHSDCVTVSPMNTGATKPYPFPRGRRTFQRIQDFDWSARRKIATKRNAVVELTVDYSIPDVRDFVIRVETRQSGRTPRPEWSASDAAKPRK
ncbi:MAG: DUF7002 family protein [Gemmatimonadaceae bacterium]